MLDLLTWNRNPWSVLDELESLQDEMNGLFAGRAQRAPRRAARRVYPPMNVWSSEEGVLVDIEVPGVDPKDVDVSIVNDELTIHGSARAENAPEGVTYHRRERHSGEFTRTVQLPYRADTAAVKATYNKGILRVVVPRSEEEKPRRITVEA